MNLSSAGRHLVRCHLFGPDGSFLPHYASNVLTGGTTGSVAFTSALNDPPGRYRINLTDVLTGASAETTVLLK
jgi:hypothetical protein